MATSKTPPEPVSKIYTIAGDAITVQLRPLPDHPTDIIFHLSRNGTKEEKFSIQEFTQVLQIANTLLAQARSKTLNLKQ